MKRFKHLFLFSFIFLYSIHIAHSESYTLDKVSIDLVKPWGMSFIDDENLLVTQKSGEILKINLTTNEVVNLKHSLKVSEVGWQGGMLDILYDKGRVYVSYTAVSYTHLTLPTNREV